MLVETTLHVGHLSVADETVLRDAVAMWMEAHPEAPAFNDGATMSEWRAWGRMESYQKNQNLIQEEENGWGMFFNELEAVAPVCEALREWIAHPRDARNCAGTYPKEVLLTCASEIYGYLEKAVSGWCEYNDTMILYRDDGEEL